MSKWVKDAKSYDLTGYGTVAVTLMRTLNADDLFQVTVSIHNGRMGWIVAEDLTLAVAEEVFAATTDQKCKEYCDSSPWSRA
jgi:hypothetical protein